MSLSTKLFDRVLLVGAVVLDLLLTTFTAFIVFLGLALLNGSLIATFNLTFGSGDSFSRAYTGFSIGIVVTLVVLALILIASIVFRENLFFSIYLLLAGSSSDGSFVEKQLIKMGYRPADSYHVGRIFSRLNK